MEQAVASMRLPRFSLGVCFLHDGHLEAEQGGVAGCIALYPGMHSHTVVSRCSVIIEISGNEVLYHSGRGVG